MLLTISKYAIAIPLLVLLYQFLIEGKWGKGLLSVISLTVFYLASEIAFHITSEGNNLILLVPYLIGEYFLISWVFIKLIPKWKQTLIISGLLLAMVIMIEFTFGIAWLPISRTAEGVILSLAAIQWFRSTYSMDERKIEKLPGFWFSCAMLVYFVPTLPIFLSGAEVFTLSPYWGRTLFNIKNALNIASKVSLTIAILKWK